MGKKTRIARDYAYLGCGFPVVLKRVELLSLGEDTVVLVNYEDLEPLVLRALIDKPTRLTGNEVRFIRQAQEKPLTDFGRLFDVSHAAVKKWENKRDNATGMGWPTEIVLRITALSKLGIKAREFMQVYESLAAPRPAGPCIIRIALESNPPQASYSREPLAEAS